MDIYTHIQNARCIHTHICIYIHISCLLTYMKPPAVNPSRSLASARPVASATQVPSMAPTAVESCARIYTYIHRWIHRSMDRYIAR